MTRLTTENGMCKCFLCGIKNPHYPDDFCTEECLNKRIIKLAEYENTGLDPKDVRVMIQKNSELRELLKSLEENVPKRCEYCSHLGEPPNEFPCLWCRGENFKYIYADEVEEVLKK